MALVPSLVPPVVVRGLTMPVIGADIAAFASFIRQCPILDGRLLTATFDGSSTITVAHGLARAYRGAIAVCATDGGRMFGVFAPDAMASVGGDPTKNIEINADTATSCTVTLWVF